MNASKMQKAPSRRCLLFFMAAAVATILALPARATMTITNARAVEGADASEMVHDLMSNDPHLRAAIAAHEAKGKPLMLDAATIVLAHGEPHEALSPSCTLSEQTSTFYYDNVKLIFIPDAYSAGYWDGTVEALQYDSQGSLAAEYLADVTGEAPDETTPLTTTYQHLLYSFDRDHSIRVKVTTPQGNPDGTSLGTKSGAPRTETYKDYLLPKVEWLGGWGDWAKCTGAGCVAAGVGCGVGNVIDEEIGWLPCTAVGCIGSAVWCTWGTLWK